MSFRFLGIDAYESRTRDKEEKVKGLKAKTYLRQLIEGRYVIMETSKSGKFGRWLAEIWEIAGVDDNGDPIKGDLINEKMVLLGHAVYKDY